MNHELIASGLRARNMASTPIQPAVHPVYPGAWSMAPRAVTGLVVAAYRGIIVIVAIVAIVAILLWALACRTEPRMTATPQTPDVDYRLTITDGKLIPIIRVRTPDGERVIVLKERK